MRTLEAFYQKASPYVWSIVRIVVALLFMEHGSQKLFAYPPSDHGTQPVWSLGWVAGVLEFFGGLFVLIGLGTRPVAFLLSGQMAVAYFMAHAPRGFFPAVNGGELAALYCFVFLAIWFLGAGPISLDALFRRKAAPAPMTSEAPPPPYHKAE